MIIIGEKINGAIPKTGAAIASKDRDYIFNLAVQQSEAGANFIDVCASTAPEEELETMLWLLDIVLEATNTPICIDSPDARIIEAVFPKVEQPGLINSVSLEGDKIDVIFPMIADTDWECVALLCDNNGIPSTVEQRLAIAREIVSKAGEYGIGTNRLHIDPLVMALSTDGSSMTKFTECCKTLLEWYPDIHVTSGLSNISYGLPLRRNINQSFLILAMNAGMDCAILDPLDREMMAALLSTDALLENDRHCRNYTTAFRKGRIGKPKK